jgi:hypothetical protein
MSSRVALECMTKSITIIYSLSNDTVSISNCTTSNDMMTKGTVVPMLN